MRRIVRSVVTPATLVLALVATPVVAQAASPFDRYLDQELSWGACLFTPPEQARPMECALVTVPRDWADPDAGVDLSVSISRTKATGERLGAILLNPGGPGARAAPWPGPWPRSNRP
ncbi:hypothetical protein [Plantactinospora veratri]